MLSICQLQVHNKSRLCMDLFTWHSMRVPDRTKKKKHKREGKQIQRKKIQVSKQKLKTILFGEKKGSKPSK